MNPITNVIIFIQALCALLLIVCMWWGVGTALLRLLRITLRGTSQFVITLCLGIAATLLLLDISTLFSLIIVRIVVFWCLAVLGLYLSTVTLQTIRAKRKKVLLLIREWKWTLLISVFAVVSFAATVSFSWLPTTTGLQFQQGVLHDSVWHVALAKELQSNFPVQHPSSYVDLLQNYHYYYDLLLATASSSTTLPIHSIHYQALPLLLAILLVLGIASLCLQVSSDQRLIRWSIFFVFFGGNAGYLIPFFLDRSEWGESTFWVSQTFSMLINPQLILSFTLFTAVILLLLQYLQSNQRHLLLLVSIISLSLAGIKMYGYVVTVVVVLAVVLWTAMRKRSVSIFVTALGVGILFGAQFFRFTDVSQAGLLYEPMWFINTMVEAPDRLSVIDWKLKEEHYIENGSTLHIIVLKAIELGVFYGGNLGSRVLFIVLPILVVLYLLIKKRMMKLNAGYAALLSLSFIFATSIPLLYIQSGIVWNTIQFWYYGIFVASLLAAYTTWVITIALRGQSLLRYAFILLMIILTIPAWLKTIPKQVLSTEQIPISLVQSLTTIDKTDRALICPMGNDSQFTFGTSFVRAIGNGRVYLANPVQLELVGLEGYKREKEYAQQWSTTEEVDALIATTGSTVVICENSQLSDQIESVVGSRSARLLRW